MPRVCGKCRFWHRAGITSDGFADCLLFSDDSTFDGARPKPSDAPQPLAIVVPFAGADGGGLVTAESFGCLQHEYVGQNEGIISID